MLKAKDSKHVVRLPHLGFPTLSGDVLAGLSSDVGPAPRCRLGSGDQVSTWHRPHGTDGHERTPGKKLMLLDVPSTMSTRSLEKL